MTGGFPGSVTRLGEPGFFALQYPIRLDGRFTMYPDSDRGFTSGNLYLFIGRKQALLIDTGYGTFEAQIHEHVRSLLPPGVELVLFPLRWSEMNSTCNVRSLIEAFDVETLLGVGPATLRGMEVRPRLGASLLETGRGGRHPAMVIIEGNPAPYAVDGDDGWTLAVVGTPLRHLATRWIYEPLTKTMLTSDTFGHAIRPAANGPWTVNDADDPTRPEDVARHMHKARYWWVPNADTSEMQQKVAEVIEQYDIERVAPAFGCMIEGKDAVRRHFEYVLGALA